MVAFSTLENLCSLNCHRLPQQQVDFLKSMKNNQENKSRQMHHKIQRSHSKKCKCPTQNKLLKQRIMLMQRNNFSKVNNSQQSLLRRRHQKWTRVKSIPWSEKRRNWRIYWRSQRRHSRLSCNMQRKRQSKCQKRCWSKNWQKWEKHTKRNSKI